MRNINNVFEARSIEVLDPLTKERLILFKTFSKALTHLKIEGAKSYIAKAIEAGRVVFSRELNKGVILKDYKEKWLDKRTMILVKVADKKI